MISGLVIYFLNFFTGKNKNIKIATSWFETHKSLLKENFTLVGECTLQPKTLLFLRLFEAEADRKVRTPEKLWSAVDI